MRDRKLKFILKAGLLILRVYCLFRQRKNQERIIAAFLLIPALLLLVPTYSFKLTLLQSFLFQALLVYGSLSVFWIVRYHYRLSGINFMIFILLLAKINGPIDMSYQIQQGQEELKVLQFNVLATNEAYQPTIERVLQLDPDFVSFQEVSEAWADSLEAGLSEAFPYSRVVRQKDAHQGIAVFSKYPLETEALFWNGTANISGTVKMHDEDINFLAMHTRSPTNRNKWNARNKHIQLAKKYVSERKGEFLVLGDFNTVPWDRRLLNFKSSTALKDSRKKLTPTYPTWNPFIAQIPIDYIFHSRGIGCQSLDSVEITSDHKAIMGTFQISKL